MTKIIKMSLVAAVAVAGLSTVSSANTLKEAFAATTVKGEIKAQYFTQDSSAGDSSIWTNGGNLTATTGSFNGLSAGVTFQTAHVFSENDEVRNYYGTAQDVSGSVMSESYVAYTTGNTTAKIGRQYISTPLVAGSGSRIFKESFEGFVVANTDLANTTLIGAYVTKFQGRTDGAGGEPEFNRTTVNEGAYTLYAKNTSVDNLTLQGQYATRDNATGTSDTEILYAEANYKLNAVTISAQTIQSDDGTTGASDGSLYGIKVAGKAGMVSLMAAYTTTDDEANVVSGLGNGADKSYTGGAIVGGGFSDNLDTKSFKIGASSKIGNVGFGISHANWDSKLANQESDETNFVVSYKYDKAASVTVKHSTFGGFYGTTQDSRSRVYLSYKF